MDKIFNPALYDNDFFAWHLKYAREYSMKSMDWLIDNYQFHSVVDFGCGIGSYLETAMNRGKQVRGFDIAPAAKTLTPESLHHYIEYVDCSLPMELDPHDLVLSFETAEHIEPANTPSFVDNLVKATGNILLFTAAPPGQQGCGHINCREAILWRRDFEEAGLKYCVETTIDISDAWKKLDVPKYITTNLMAFKLEA
jgi:SAM-dependent methyltransferase